MRSCEKSRWPSVDWSTQVTSQRDLIRLDDVHCLSPATLSKPINKIGLINLSLNTPSWMMNLKRTSSIMQLLDNRWTNWILITDLIRHE